MKLLLALLGLFILWQFPFMRPYLRIIIIIIIVGLLLTRYEYFKAELQRMEKGLE